jgi:hypothetical protein
MASKADKRSRQLLGNAAVENFVAIAYGGNWPIAPFAATQHVSRFLSKADLNRAGERNRMSEYTP